VTVAGIASLSLSNIYCCYLRAKAATAFSAC